MGTLEHHNQKNRDTYLRDQLRETHKDINAARKRNSWQAVAALRRQALDIRSQLDDLEREANKPIDEYQAMPDEQLIATILDAYRELPQHIRDELREEMEAIERPPLELVENDDS
jgi:ATP-dependent Lon protease